MRAVRVNETKLDFGTNLLVDLSALVGEKGTLFWGSPQSLNYSLSTLFPKHSYMRFSILL